MKKKTKAIIIFVIIILIVLMLYFIVNKINCIDNSSSLNPSGNMDVFDIDDKNVKPKPDDNKNDNKDNNNTDKSDNNSNNNNSNNNNNGNNNSNSNGNNNNNNGNSNNNSNNNNSNKTDLIVSDNYSMWNSGRVRIFSNPLYNFESKIAPGSSNGYKFAIKNSNDFDINIDFNLLEVNPLNINMKYNLKQEDSYVIGNDNVYKSASEIVVKNVKLKAKKTIVYTLNWKWIDSDNDTEIGQAENANYALTINIGANQC